MASAVVHRNMTAEELRLLYNVRFHHMITLSGRLIATLATEPWDSEGNEIAVSYAICTVTDKPSRHLGRTIALGRLEVGKCEVMSLAELKSEISDRTIMLRFITDKTARRLGYADAPTLLADLRPRAPFVPEAELEAA